MNTIPEIDSVDVLDKRVFVRCDLDVPIEEDSSGYVVKSKNRLDAVRPTVDLLLEKGAKQIILAGHIGRVDEGKSVSTFVLLSPLQEVLQRKITAMNTFDGDNFENLDPRNNETSNVFLLENLRSNPGEEENSEEFVEKLAKLADVYVNDSFATSHREHASVVSVPKLLPRAAGVRFAQEIKQLSRVLENPERPLVFLISGVKQDKAGYVEKFKSRADKVLVGGRLPEYLGEDYSDSKVLMARLVQDKEDITIRTIEHFEEEIKRAKTVVISGPLGKFEEEGHRQGTERVFRAVAEADCYSVAGGGDTEAALELLGLKDEIDWVSTGGGAMLEFLANGTLPGIEALL